MKTVVPALVVVLVLVATGVTIPSARQQAPPADGWRSIEGSWSAAGQRRTLPTESGRTGVDGPPVGRRRPDGDVRRGDPRLPGRGDHVRRRRGRERRARGVDRRARRPHLQPPQRRRDARRAPRRRRRSPAAPAATPASRASTPSSGSTSCRRRTTRSRDARSGSRAGSGRKGPPDERAGRRCARAPATAGARQGGGGRLRPGSPRCCWPSSIWFAPVPEGLTLPGVAPLRAVRRPRSSRSSSARCRSSPRRSSPRRSPC